MPSSATSAKNAKTSTRRNGTSAVGAGAADYKPITETILPTSAAGASRQSDGPTTEEIARRAFELYEAAGRQDGRELEHWLQAEAELRSRGRA